jgi:hypothetical protein
MKQNTIRYKNFTNFGKGRDNWHQKIWQKGGYKVTSELNVTCCKGVCLMKSNLIAQEEMNLTPVLAHVNMLAELICAGDEFSLLRKTLELYAEEQAWMLKCN